MPSRKTLAASALVAGIVGAAIYTHHRTGSPDGLTGPLRLPLAAPRVVVHKGARRLELYDGDRLCRRYPIVMGKGEGDKRREGDRCTPEGDFYICTRNGESRYHKFLGLSYPGPDDAERGLRENTISRAERDAIVAAHRKKECPPWKTALGGEVGIHGGGVDRPWTLGCIALTDPSVDELWAALPLGTPVRVAP